MSRLDLAADGRGDDAEEEEEADDQGVDEHLADLSDGAGCTEIWEHLSEQRGD